MKKNVFMMFALLLLAMGGAWAQSTPEPGTLVPTGNANEWTLTMPADNMLLKVSYYGEYTLDSIPTTWQVKVGNAAPVHPTAYTEGNTTLGHLTITETDSVELIPPDEVKPTIKSVTLTEPVAAPQLLSVTILGNTLYYEQGETWAEAMANHEENSAWNIFEESSVLLPDYSILTDNGNDVDANAPVYTNGDWSSHSF